MATKNFRSTVLEPTSEFAHGDKLRFTALATVGEVLKGSFSETTIGEDGVYSVDLQYGKHRIDYKPYEGVWRHFADVEVNADTLSTTLQDLALASVPVTDEAVLVLQGILADAEAAKTAAETAESAAETALASIDSTVAEVEAGYPSLLAAQLSKSVTVNTATGDDTTADGSSAKPYKTIKKAIESQPDLVSIVITLAGGTDKASAHVIDSTIILSKRHVIANLGSEHILLSDGLSIVFSANGGSFTTNTGGGGVIHANTNKILMSCNAGSSLNLGGYSATKFAVASDATITMMQHTYMQRVGSCNVTSFRLYFVDPSDLTSATSAKIRTVAFDGTGSCFFSHSASSLGANYADSGNFNAITTQLAGTFKVCAI